MFGFKKIDRSNIDEFKKNYLRSVVVQVRFDNSFKLDDRIDTFKETFKDEFPRFKEQSKHSLNVTIGEDETPIIEPSKKVSNGFNLRSESGNKLLSCNTDAVTLNIAGVEYKNFEQLKDFLNKLQNLLESCGLDSLSRVSIRKINIIDFNIPENEEVTPYQLMEFILNNNLVGKSEAIPSSSSIEQSIQSLTLQKKSYRLILRYGMIVHSPKNKKGQVLIDIDCINNNSVAVRNIKSEFESINSEIFNIFNWCLSEEAYKQLLNEK